MTEIVALPSNSISKPFWRILKPRCFASLKIIGLYIIIQTCV